MDDGIYRVTLTRHNQPIAEAILVLKDGLFNGGGEGYLFRGSYDRDTDTIRGEVLAYDKEQAPIYAIDDRYTVALLRDIQQPNLVFSGLFNDDPARPITAEFSWKVPLAR
jgi:T3SS negative regulator,GrlR